VPPFAAIDRVRMNR